MLVRNLVVLFELHENAKKQVLIGEDLGKSLATYLKQKFGLRLSEKPWLDCEKAKTSNKGFITLL